MASYTVTNVVEDQTQDTQGNLTDVYDIIFTLPNRVGNFTVQVAQDGDVVAAAQTAIEAKANDVEGIYAL